MTNRAKIIFKITFVMAILSYSFWSYLKETYNIRIFYPGIALCFTGYIFVIYEFIRIGYKKDKKLNNMLMWVEVVLMSSVSSFIDELFFDATAVGLNEFIGFLIIILIALYNERSRSKKLR